MKYTETWAGARLEAYPVRFDAVELAKEAEQLREDEVRMHRVTYPDSQREISLRSAEIAVESRLPVSMISGTSYEIAARFRLVRPEAPWSVLPEVPAFDIGVLRQARQP
jgi:hypothetical protein